MGREAADQKRGASSGAWRAFSAPNVIDRGDPRWWGPAGLSLGLWGGAAAVKWPPDAVGCAEVQLEGPAVCLPSVPLHSACTAIRPPRVQASTVKRESEERTSAESMNCMVQDADGGCQSEQPFLLLDTPPTRIRSILHFPFPAIPSFCAKCPHAPKIQKRSCLGRYSVRCSTKSTIFGGRNCPPTTGAFQGVYHIRSFHSANVTSPWGESRYFDK